MLNLRVGQRRRKQRKKFRWLISLILELEQHKLFFFVTKNYHEKERKSVRSFFTNYAFSPNVDNPT